MIRNRESFFPEVMQLIHLLPIHSIKCILNTLPTLDFWKRRGQTRVALGQVKEGLKDLSKYALHYLRSTVLYGTLLYRILFHLTVLH
jgi:hypothetical protein